MELSGINQQFAQLPEMLQMQMAQQPPPIAVSEARKFTKIVIKAFAPDKLRQAITKYFRTHYDNSRYRKLLSLLNDPLVKKMTGMESLINNLESQQRMMQQANIFMAQIPPRRVALLREIDQAVKGAEFIVALNIKEFQTISKAVNPLLPDGQQMSGEKMEAISQEIRAQNLYPSQQEMVLQMAWAYRQATDEELEQYLKLYRSEIGQWSIKLLFDASMAVFDGALERVSNQIRRKMLSGHSA